MSAAAVQLEGKLAVLCGEECAQFIPRMAAAIIRHGGDELAYEVSRAISDGTKLQICWAPPDQQGNIALTRLRVG